MGAKTPICREIPTIECICQRCRACAWWWIWLFSQLGLY